MCFLLKPPSLTASCEMASRNSVLLRSLLVCVLLLKKATLARQKINSFWFAIHMMRTCTFKSFKGDDFLIMIVIIDPSKA